MSFEGRWFGDLLASVCLIGFVCLFGWLVGWFVCLIASVWFVCLRHCLQICKIEKTDWGDGLQTCLHFFIAFVLFVCLQSWKIEKTEREDVLQTCLLLFV